MMDDLLDLLNIDPTDNDSFIAQAWFATTVSLFLWPFTTSALIVLYAIQIQLDMFHHPVNGLETTSATQFVATLMCARVIGYKINIGVNNAMKEVSFYQIFKRTAPIPFWVTAWIVTKAWSLFKKLGPVCKTVFQACKRIAFAPVLLLLSTISKVLQCLMSIGQAISLGIERYRETLIGEGNVHEDDNEDSVEAGVLDDRVMIDNRESNLVSPDAASNSGKRKGFQIVRIIVQPQTSAEVDQEIFHSFFNDDDQPAYTVESESDSEDSSFTDTHFKTEYPYFMVEDEHTDLADFAENDGDDHITEKRFKGERTCMAADEDTGRAEHENEPDQSVDM